MKDNNLESKRPSEQILSVLKKKGMQTSVELSVTLNMKRKNVDSLLSRLCQKNKIIRVSLGVYRISE